SLSSSARSRAPSPCRTCANAWQDSAMSRSPARPKIARRGFGRKPQNGEGSSARPASRHNDAASKLKLGKASLAEQAHKLQKRDHRACKGGENRNRLDHQFRSSAAIRHCARSLNVVVPGSAPLNGGSPRNEATASKKIRVAGSCAKKL